MRQARQVAGGRRRADADEAHVAVLQARARRRWSSSRSASRRLRRSWALVTMSVRTPCGVSMVADRRTALPWRMLRLGGPCRWRRGLHARLRGPASRRSARAGAVRNPAWCGPAYRASPSPSDAAERRPSGRAPSARTPKVQLRSPRVSRIGRAERILSRRRWLPPRHGSAPRRRRGDARLASCARHGRLVVEAEPALDAPGCGASGSTAITSRNTCIAEAQQVIVRAHVRMRAALGWLDAQHIAHPGDAGGEARAR